MISLYAVGCRVHNVKEDFFVFVVTSGELLRVSLTSYPNMSLLCDCVSVVSAVGGVGSAVCKCF